MKTELMTTHTQHSVDAILEGISSIKRDFAELPNIHRHADEILFPEECADFVADKLQLFVTLFNYVKSTYEIDFRRVWNQHYNEDRSQDLLAVSNQLVVALKSLYDWEVSINSVIPDESWCVVFRRLRNSSLELVQTTESFFLQIRDMINNSNGRRPQEVDIQFTMPKQLLGIEESIRQANQHYIHNMQTLQWTGLFESLEGCS